MQKLWAFRSNRWKMLSPLVVAIYWVMILIYFPTYLSVIFGVVLVILSILFVLIITKSISYRSAVIVRKSDLISLRSIRGEMTYADFVCAFDDKETYEFSLEAVGAKMLSVGDSILVTYEETIGGKVLTLPESLIKYELEEY